MILSICDLPDTLKVIRIIKIVINIVRIAVPIMLIVTIMIDLLKNVHSGDDLTKTGELIYKRILASVLVFLIPTFTKVIIDVIDPSFEYKKCFDMATPEIIESKYIANMDKLMENLKLNPTISTYNNAKMYLSNITNTELRKDYTNKINEYNDVVSPKNSEVVITDRTDFLAVAKIVWQKIVLGPTNYTYGMSRIPPTKGKVDCSSLVNWVLLEYGYEDFRGAQHTTFSMYHTNYNKKYGWQEIYFKAGTDLTNLVRPGDIVVRRNILHGHTDIIIKREGNNVYAYDAGNGKYIANGKNPNGVKVNWFMKDDRPGKIIRVTPAK